LTFILKKIQTMTKNTVALSLMLAFAGFSSAQTVDTKKMNDLVAKKDYLGAITEANNLKKQVMGLASAELKKAFPNVVGEFAAQPNEQVQGDMMGGLSLQITYAKPPKEKSAKDSVPGGPAMIGMPGMPGMGGDGNAMNLNLSTNLSMAFELMNAHSGAEQMPGMGEGSSEPLRIKGYRALLKQDQFSGAVGQMIVGGAFIEVRAMGMKDTKTVKSLLEAIDTEKLKGIVGE